MPPFEILPGAAESPVILHVPHSALAIPDWVRRHIVLDGPELTAELARMTDARTDEIAAAAVGQVADQLKPWRFVNRLSRLVVDPERFPDEREELAASGMGAVYTSTSRGERLRADDPEHEEELLEAFFRPYGSAFAALVAARLEALGRVVVIDVHSYPKDPLPYELHADSRRPEVCLGSDEMHTPVRLLDAGRDCFGGRSRTAVNEPFIGTYVPLAYLESEDRRVESIMIEIRRDTYADEAGTRRVVEALACLVRRTSMHPTDPGSEHDPADSAGRATSHPATARDDAVAAGEVVGDALAGTTNLFHRMHKAISNRVFDAVGPESDDTRVMHDAIADGVYESVAFLQSVIPRAAGTAAAEAIAPDTPSVAETPTGQAFVAAAQGVAGEHLTGRHPALSEEMRLRSGGTDVATTREAVAAAYPGATGRVVVLLHGWSVTETCWSWRPKESADRPADPDVDLDYGARLHRDLGYTPIYVRYNTGLHISDNGHRLAVLLDALLDVWPTEVETVSLVGYSMGGLVARSACHYAEQSGSAWQPRLGSVVCLGTPHLGAPLERGAHVLGWALAQLPETEALGGLVDSRSAGVKDLRFGAVTTDQWSLGDAEELLVDRVTGAEVGSSQEVYLLSARLGAEETPFSRVLGDLLVPEESSSGASSRHSIPVVQDGLVRVLGVSHLGILNNPEVYAALRRWLDPATRTPAGSRDY